MIHQFYKSPITLETELVHRHAALMLDESKKAVEDAICEAVLSCNIIVDKEELQKALEYDRAQWDEGYRAGYSEGLENGKAEALARIKEVIVGGDEDD